MSTSPAVVSTMTRPLVGSAMDVMVKHERHLAKSSQCYAAFGLCRRSLLCQPYVCIRIFPSNLFNPQLGHFSDSASSALVRTIVAALSCYQEKLEKEPFLIGVYGSRGICDLLSMFISQCHPEPISFYARKS